MRRHLARNVYRRLLANRGLLATRPAITSDSLRLQRVQEAGIGQPWHVPRRTFLGGFFKKAPRAVKEPQLEPGYQTLLEYMSSETTNVRPPATEDLIDAWQRLFTFKTRKKRVVNSTQANCAVALFRYLHKSPGGKKHQLSLEDMKMARDALLLPPKDTAVAHLELSKLIYQEIRARSQTVEGEQRSEDGIANFRTGYGLKDLRQYLTALSLYGEASEALDILSNSTEAIGRKHNSMWSVVLAGLAREGNEEALLQGAEAAEKAGRQYTGSFREIMTAFYASRGNTDGTQKWFTKRDGEETDFAIYATPGEYLAILNLQRGTWTDSIFRELCDSNPPKEYWDIVFRWAITHLGQGIDDIKHMMNTMVRHNEADPDKRPDITSINGMVEAAIQSQQTLLAERLMNLAQDMRLLPDFKTYMLQLEYLINAKDLVGAQKAFEALQDIGCPHGEDLPIINKYIRALCSQPKIGTERLVRVLSTVEERQVTVEPPTVISLCMAFLRDDQQHEVIDTLSIHSFQFSVLEREEVREAFVQYVLDPANSTARVWDVYQLMQQFFPDTGYRHRVQMMDGFFIRKRPDMASFVFGHMRAHDNSHMRPKHETYIRCLEGLGCVPDTEEDCKSVKMIHNMLKMDLTIQMDTKIYTALMIAYAANGDADRALDFWKDITDSAEGPSYNSLKVVFWVCEQLPFGDRHARAIWAKLQRMDVDIPQEVADAYCGSLARQGKVDDTKEFLNSMPAVVGYRATEMTLGVAYNALPGALKAEFQEWAEAEYPTLWQKLETYGRSKRRGPGLDMFKINREMTA